MNDINRVKIFKITSEYSEQLYTDTSGPVHEIHTH